MSKLTLRFRILASDRVIEVSGQEARTLAALYEAQDQGVTALEVSTWALRLAHYVFKLKGLGLTIETMREKHAGPVSGWHGRYVLRTGIQIIEQDQRAA